MDRAAWDLFWIVREGTSGEHPIDIEAALRLYDRLYGPGDDMRIVKAIQAMDRAFQRFRSDKLKPKTPDTKGDT